MTDRGNTLGADRALGIVAEVWKDLDDGHGPPGEDRARIAWAAGRGADVYGELEPQAFLTLLRRFRPGPHDVFADLGSGTGKLPALAAMASPVGQAVGIELSEHRHATATNAWRLLHGLPETTQATERIRYQHGDFRDALPDNLSLAFACATAFPDALNDAAAHAAAAKPTLRAFATTRPLTNPRLLGLEQLGRIDLPASWSPRVGVFLYRRRSGSP